MAVLIPPYHLAFLFPIPSFSQSSFQNLLASSMFFSSAPCLSFKLFVYLGLFSLSLSFAIKLLKVSYTLPVSISNCLFNSLASFFFVSHRRDFLSFLSLVFCFSIKLTRVEEEIVLHSSASSFLFFLPFLVIFYFP